jgi:ribokinase
MFGDARLCLLPIEILAEPMLYALDICKQRGIVTIVKPSLQTHLPEKVLSGIDYLVPNEKELYHLLDGEGIEDRAERLYSQGVSHVIVTLGNRGCYLKDREYSLYIPAVDFNAVDVTGAADAFIAALAVALNHGNDIVTAICSATYAAGISITRMGVQTALADELTIEAYSDSIRKMASELKEVLD